MYFSQTMLISVKQQPLIKAKSRWIIPKVGTFYSQCWNSLFPVWEKSERLPSLVRPYGLAVRSLRTIIYFHACKKVESALQNGWKVRSIVKILSVFVKTATVFIKITTIFDKITSGIYLFQRNLRRFIPGAYVQYVRFAGKDRAGDIMTEHEFKDNLCTILPELDTFIKTTIANRRPIPVSALREDPFVDYPDWATRELLMNAICHRDYTSNGPIQFYQYDDRIEIMNHGGLYGRANEQNFPTVNDYRNIVVAEAMKVLGFVNRHSRGVLRVQKDLKANENGEAVYDFSYQTAVMVRENKSPRGERAMEEAVANGFLMENGQKNGQGKRSDLTISDQKPSKKPSKKPSSFKIPEFPSQLVEDVYKALKLNRKAKYSWLADNLGVSESTILRAINDLKGLGYINPEHSKIKGEWQLLR